MKTGKLQHFIAVLVVGVLTSAVLAQPGVGKCDGQCEGPGKGKGPGPQDPAKRLENIKAKLIEAVSATDEQKTQIEQILETHAQAMKNWQKENQDKIKAAREKFEAAKKTHMEEMKTIRESRKELQTNLKKQLGEVLSKEQMEKAEKVLTPRRRMQGRRGMIGKMAGKGKGPGQCTTCDQGPAGKGMRGGPGKRFGKGRRQGPGRRFGQGPKGPGRGGQGMPPMKELNITDEQKEQIKAIMKDSWNKAKDTKDIKAKQEIFEAARKKIHDEVFTDEQRAKAKELRLKHHPLGKIASEEQIDKADEIMKAAFEESAKAKDPKEKWKIIKAAQDKIENEVLTEEQRTKLKEERAMQRRNMRNQFLGKVGLTDEQQAKADAIMDDAMAKAKDIEDPKERFKIMSEAHKKIRDEVMTEEQRKELRKMWNKHHRPRGPRGRGNRPPRPGKGDDQTPPPPPPAPEDDEAAPDEA